MTIELTPDLMPLLYPNEGTYQWFFNEIVNRQSRIDQIVYCESQYTPPPTGWQDRVSRLEKEKSNLIKRAQSELPNDQNQRLGVMFINATKGSRD